MIKIIKRKFRTLYNLVFNKYIGQIYMLHRVCPFENGKLSCNENMKVSPEYLERFIIDRIAKFEFLNLDQLLSVIKKNINQLNNLSFSPLTMDMLIIIHMHIRFLKNTTYRLQFILRQDLLTEFLYCGGINWKI